MTALLKKYKRPLALLLFLLLGIGLWQGSLLWADYRVHKARAATFDAELGLIEARNTAISFRVPYDSGLFSPENIGLGQLDAAAQQALDRLLASMTYDADATDEGCFPNENILISAALPQGRMTISIGDGTLCAVDITRDGVHWENAAYTYDPAARDALLACGGLPTIGEMKTVIEADLQDRINDLGDLAEETVFK